MKKLVFLGDSRVKKKGKGKVQLFPSDRGHRLAKSRKNETQNEKKEETPENRFCLTLVSFGFFSVFPVVKSIGNKSKNFLQQQQSWQHEPKIENGLSDRNLQSGKNNIMESAVFVAQITIDASTDLTFERWFKD